MTACTATGTPIVGEVCWVNVGDAPPLPMCVAHFQADDCGRHLLAEFNDDPRVVTIIAGFMAIPCPQPIDVPEPEPDEGDQEALDRIWINSGGPPDWERVES